MKNQKVLRNFYNTLRENSLLILDTDLFRILDKVLIAPIIEREFSINNEKYVLITRPLDIKDLGYGVYAKISREIYKVDGKNLVFCMQEIQEQIFYHPET